MQDPMARLTTPYLALSSDPCADPGFFGGGGVVGVQDDLTKKGSDNVFLVLSLFYKSQMVNFKENYHFPRFRRGSNIFQGGGPIAYSL